MGVTTSPPGKRPPGRPPGDSGTREAILDAALLLFAERGYDATSMRAIAAEAGVDPALVRHFHSDKATLFAATFADRSGIPERLARCLAGDPATRAHRLADTYLGLWEDPDTRPILLAVAKAAMTSPHADELPKIIGAAVSRGGIADPNGQDGRLLVLASSHLLGTAIARHILHTPPIASMTHDQLIDAVTPAIHCYV